MSKVIVVTDSNSGITPDEAKKLGVEVIPMPFYIDEQMYYENIDLSSSMRSLRQAAISRHLCLWLVM